MDIDFSNTTFSIIENSEKETVNLNIIFTLKQLGDLVSGDYHHGTIVCEKSITAYRNMRYRYLTNVNEKLTNVSKR
jgi:hypothetical protein